MKRHAAALVLQRWIKGILFMRRAKPILVEKEDGRYVLGASIIGR